MRTGLYYLRRKYPCMLSIHQVIHLAVEKIHEVCNR